MIWFSFGVVLKPLVALGKLGSSIHQQGFEKGPKIFFLGSIAFIHWDDMLQSLRKEDKRKLGG
jgi:hypothetical protein